MKTEQEIKTFIQSLYTEEELYASIDEGIAEFLDEDWEEEYDSEYDWYQEYGRGEAEGIINSEILDKLNLFLGETDFNWYQYKKYGDVQEWIHEIYPQLNVA